MRSTVIIQFMLSFPLLFAASAVSGQTPVLDLTRQPTWETRQAFTRIASVVVLAPGRALLVDVGDSRVVLIERNGTAVRSVGRNGGGPGEYQQPVSLHYGADGGSYLVDQGLNVVHTIDGTGTLTGYLHPPASMNRRLRRVHGVDASGRILLSGMDYARGVGVFDSIAIIRWDPRDATIDTIGMAKSGVTGSVTGGAVSLTQKPFAWADEWTVTPRGAVAIARVEPYRVDLIETGGTQPVVGQPLSYQRQRVTASIRNAYRDRIAGAGAPPPPVSVGRNGVSQTVTPPVARRVSIPDSDFPEYLPPFHGRDAIVAGSDGRPWVQQLGDAHTAEVVWDLFDPNGKRMARVRLPRAVRVAAAGSDGVYTVREDDESGEQFLQFRALP